ncbi:IQ and AAA domain-containing protein 1 [Channa argus]|uniref:IQ and AAA domain-containing protein 1 n=1 Tax=Channa argus TaxID=215402 RepID=A0A6G1PD66_CHAAH|nr:IQ and AAA domain-containing protein 1 [Channa argus]
MTSHRPSYRNWTVTHRALQDLIKEEVSADPAESRQDRLKVFQDRAILYLKYLKIFRSLEEVYEQLVQPQRRRGVLRILEGLMGRLLELKAQMVDLDRSEVHCFDELLLDLKMTPKDLQIPIPRYFQRKRKKQMVVNRLLEKHQQNHLIPANPSGTGPAQLQAQQVSTCLRLIQDQNEEEYQRVQLSVKQLVLDVEGTDIKQTLQDQIRQWFFECRDLTGRFPDLPDVDHGGSESLFSQISPEQVLLQLSAQEDQEMKKKERTGNRKQKKKKKKKKKKQAQEDKHVNGSSFFLPDVVEGHRLYTGEFSYLASSVCQVNGVPTPSLSDVRELITLYAVLPLGSQAVLERFPMAKTLLLVGPSGVGKKMLVQAICTETGAHLFHLSHANLSHTYPGRRGATYLLHLVFKVAAELQPSVIWIEDAEKTFCKNKSKINKQFDPQRLKKDLLKSLKTLKPEARVLVIGTSQRPFEAKIKPFCKIYKKIILIPKPDYSSRRGTTLWRDLLHTEGAEPGPSLDLSSLAKITDGFTAGHILTAVRSVLRPHRLKKLHLQPLTATEFVQSLSKMDPVYQEEEEAFKIWFRKTPLCRKRARGAKTNEEVREKRGKTGKKKKKKKDDKNKKKKKEK